MFESAPHYHPASLQVTVGVRLKANDVVAVGDVYDSTVGHWAKVSDAMVGMKITKGCATHIVRPSAS